MRTILPFAFALALAGSAGCGKKKENDAPIAPPPPRGAANIDQLSTGLGVARGLDASLASPSVRFEQIHVLDDRRAILAGGVPGGEAVALITQDAGKTWRSLRVDRDSWSTWAFNDEGAMALAIGPKELPEVTVIGPGKKLPPPPPFGLYFANLDAPSFGTPTSVEQGGPAKAKDPRTPVIKPKAALIDRDMAAFVVEEAPKKQVVRYAAAPGTDAGNPQALPKTETFSPTPLGRPPRLFSVKGRDLQARKWPDPGKPLGDPELLDKVKVTPTLLNELAMPPACESGAVTFQRILQPPTGKPVPGKPSGPQPFLLAVSGDRVSLVPMPAEAAKDVRVGCSPDHFVVEVPATDKESISLALCDLEGKCAVPSRPVFKPWLEKHERELSAMPTPQGALVMISSRAGERWGLYYAQSIDGGQFYERARVVGEGNGDRGRIELGAMVSFGKRLLLLLSADVTGTSRRGWYVIVSDDGGVTWNQP
jgi:hypothetical protein